MTLGALIQEPRPDRAVERADLVEQRLALGAAAVGLQDHVADFAVGLQVLRGDVEVAPRERPLRRPSMPGTLRWTWM